MNTFTYSDKLETATTMRKPVETFLHIDSNDRYKFDPVNLLYNDTKQINENNFILNNNQNFNAGYFKRLAVTEVDLPFVTPNVNQYNNKLWFQGEDTDLLYALIPEGFYTGEELADTIEASLNSGTDTFQADGTVLAYGNPNWTVSYNSDGTFTFENSEDTFAISTGFASQWDVQSVRGRKTINDLIGFNYGGPEPALVDSQTGGVASLAFTRYIDVVSNKLTKFQNAKDGLTQINNYNGILCRIYLDNSTNIINNMRYTGTIHTTEGVPDSFGMTTLTPYVPFQFGTRPVVNIYREYKNPKWIEWNRNEFVSDLDIKLYDDQGQLLYIPTKNQGSNFYLTLQLSES